MSSRPNPTHAGGVVYRGEPGAPEFLLVTARREPSHWVYPKGHIEQGETPEQAATREVHEESGVTAEIVELLEDVRIQLAGEDQIVRYFLMRAVRDGSPREGRHSVWMSSADALQRLSFPEARGSLDRALRLMKQRGLL